MVCNDHECSSLLVPVDFPEECSLEDGMEECVINNVHNLNHQGDNLIQERMNVFAEEEEAQKAHEIFKLISDSEYLKRRSELPEWWVSPTSSDYSECSMIESLLNGADWQLEMRCLCKEMLQESGTDDEVQLARVKAIGSTGMILEAHVLLGGKSIDDYGGMNNIAIVDVPIKFPSERYGDASIRDHVLNIVSSVSVS